MILPIKDLIIMGFGSLLLVVWLVVFLLSRKYDSIFAPLDEKEYPLKELFSTGYVLLELSKYQFKSKHDRKIKKEIEVLYGEKYADYYIRVIYSQQFTYAMLLMLGGFLLYGFCGEFIILVIMFMFAGLAIYYYSNTVTEKINKRSKQMLIDFSEAIAKLALLTNAGMILKEAWEEVAKRNDTALYQEMHRAVEDMKNGVSEIESIRLFGTRCMVPEIKKFSSTIIQGLTKGNRELVVMLQNQSKEVWAMRKQMARRQGELASSKLLFPIMIMFVGILIMVMVPIFANLGI